MIHHTLTFRMLLLALLAVRATSASETYPVRARPIVSDTATWGKAFIGSVEPARRSVVGTAVAGRVDAVFAEPGDIVNGGGRLAQLRLTAVRIRLRSAQAALEASQQQLTELVHGPRAETLRRLAARAKGAEAILINATKKYDRLAALSQRGATAKGDLDEALSAKDAAEQLLIAAKAEHQEAVAGTRDEQLAQGKAIVAQARETVNQIQDELDQHTVKAPFRGYVVRRLAEKGEWVSVGDPLAEIIELDPAEVRVAVPEEFVARLKQGLDVRVVVDAISTEKKNNDLAGTIFRIIPDADARSRSFPVRIRIDNPTTDGHPLLKPGMLARVYLPVGKSEPAMLVPQDAIVLDRSRAYLFVVDQTSSPATVRRIEVETGPSKNAFIQVKPRGRSLLRAGSLVVTEGNERLQSGQAVTVL